jgi:hypothetical protein
MEERENRQMDIMDGWLNEQTDKTVEIDGWMNDKLDELMKLIVE